MLESLDPRLIYKVLSQSLWGAFLRSGQFAGSADDQRDGYIHLSTAEQLPGTLARHFAGCADLVLLAVKPDLLGELLRMEPSRGGALFPHCYGPLPLAACTLIARRVRADDAFVRSHA